ncbi:hypothetical protein ACWDTQ_26525 [Streptomyces cellulosae]
MTVYSEDMARVAYNALAFLPARSQVKTARVQVGPAGLCMTGTDGYAIGQDRCPVEAYEGPSEGLTVHVDRTALADLDTGGRKDKKGFGRLEVHPADGLIFRPANNDVPTAGRDLSAEAHHALWDAVDSLFTRLEAREAALPELVAFDPALLSRFSKVKTPKGKNGLDRALDMKISHPKQPILIKLGPTFEGVIMPIDRDVHEENVGEEGLW